MPRLHLQRSVRIALVALYSVAHACSPTDASSDGPDGDVSVSVPPGPYSLTVGAQVVVTVTIVRENNDRPMTLSATGLPTGVTATFDPAVLSGTVLTSRLTLAASIDAPASGTVAPVQVGISNGSFQASSQLGLSVSLPGVVVALAGTGSGTVTSNPTGINCGAACNARFAGGSSVTLTAAPASGSVFAGWSGGCSGSSATCALTIGAPTTNVTATFNSTAAGFSVVVGSASVSLPQAGSASVDVTIARANGYAGAVSFSVAGAPSGLTVTPNPASTTGNTATLGVTATPSLGAGSYPITLSASGAGIGAPQTAALKVMVTATPSGSGAIGFSYASCDPSEVPIWFAAQSGSGAWARVLPVNSTFQFVVVGTGGIAYVTRSGSDFETHVTYGSASDLAALAVGGPCDGMHARTGTAALTGSFVVGPVGGTWTAAMGGASVQAPFSLQGAPFVLDRAPRGPVDLIGLALAPGTNGAVGFSKMILRRNVAYTASIPALNFGSPESFVPVGGAHLFLTNLGRDHTGSDVALITSNGATRYFSATDDPRIAPYPTVPDSLARPDDMYAITAFAAPSASSTSYRFAGVARHRAARDTVALGPALTTPTVTTVTAAPYARLRAQLPTQGAYNAAVALGATQGSTSLEVVTLASYVGTTPASWTIEVPDLTSAGYDAAWAPRSTSLSWEVIALGGSVLPFLGGTLQDGAVVLGAATSSAPAAIRSLSR